MLSRFAIVSLDEFKSLGTRVALYTAVAYLTVRVVSSVSDRVARWTGLSSEDNS